MAVTKKTAGEKFDNFDPTLTFFQDSEKIPRIQQVPGAATCWGPT